MSERYVTAENDSAASTGHAASSIIMTVVFSIVILVALVVGIMILLHYHIL